MILTDYKTKYYNIRIWDDKYHVTNNETGVAEASTTVLPEALEIMDFLTEQLEKKLNEDEVTAGSIQPVDEEGNPIFQA